MSRRPRRFSASAVVAVVVVCVALAAPAFGFASKVTRGVVVRKGASASVTATCPHGEHVGFGGLVAEFVAPPHSGAIVLPEGMRRTAPDRWTVTGTSASDKTGSRLTAVGYCATGAVPSTASGSRKVPGSEVGTAVATCPVGSVVVGGGFNAGASMKNQEVVAKLAASSPRTWAVTVQNITGTATTLTALAYCAPGAAAQQHSSTATLLPHKGGTARVSCPAGTSLVFAGLLAHSRVVGKHAAVIAPFSWTATSPTQWVVTAYNAGDVSGSVDALAYCR